MVGAPARRTGTTCFTLDSRVSAPAAAELGERDIRVWSSHADVWKLTRALGIRDIGVRFDQSLPHIAQSDSDRVRVGLRLTPSGSVEVPLLGVSLFRAHRLPLTTPLA